MFVVDKVVDEDRRDELTESAKTEAILPNGATTKLGPSAHDAYAVFEDLCLLANSEHPRFLKLDSLRKTFALELIESVLTSSSLFKCGWKVLVASAMRMKRIGTEVLLSGVRAWKYVSRM